MLLTSKLLCEFLNQNNDNRNSIMIIKTIQIIPESIRVVLLWSSSLVHTGIWNPFLVWITFDDVFPRMNFLTQQTPKKLIKVDDKDKLLMEETRPLSRTKCTSNHILRVGGSLKKSIFWMKKLHFWISTPMWRVAKIHFFSSKNDFFSKSIRVVLKPFRGTKKPPKPRQIH